MHNKYLRLVTNLFLVSQPRMFNLSQQAVLGTHSGMLEPRVQLHQLPFILTILWAHEGSATGAPPSIELYNEQILQERNTYVNHSRLFCIVACTGCFKKSLQLENIC